MGKDAGGKQEVQEDEGGTGAGQGPVYSLPGRQVEPGSAYWADLGKRIEVVEVDALPDSTIDAFDDRPSFLEEEIAELIELSQGRTTAPIAGGAGKRKREELSAFLYLNPFPITAIYNTSEIEPKPVSDVFEQCRTGNPIVRNGAELARLFEDETPGLLHRHALNCLLFGRNISPTRQARIWMALDVTIYSALLAAWHFKWANISGGQADFSRVYRERPIEYELRRSRTTGQPPRFEVLYDRRVGNSGTETGPLLCPDPQDPGRPDPNVPSPGTPRHPAYPSGHSTYSAAATSILKYFFAGPDDQGVRNELDKLADNIGMARLWAGVHWRQDHTAGQKLGQAVARKVIGQLQSDPVERMNCDKPDRCDLQPRPDFDQVRDEGKAVRRGTSKKPIGDTICPPLAPALVQGSQRGA